MNGRPTAAAAGKIDVGGDLTVNRLGFGAMRITGPGIWGDDGLCRGLGPVAYQGQRSGARCATARALALICVARRLRIVVLSSLACPLCQAVSTGGSLTSPVRVNRRGPRPPQN
jgi:hypothetical protein